MSEPIEEGPAGLVAPELTDGDVYDAMAQLSGYLDITTEDFRELYRLAYVHAMERLVGSLCAADLMQASTLALVPAQSLAEAVAVMAEGRLKSMPVTDGQGLVVGMLSETDVLRWLGAATFAELLHRSPQGLAEVDAQLHGADVGSVMVSPAITVEATACFAAVMEGFRRHRGRRMPVVDEKGRLVGVLARKDFIAACPVGVAA